jgi:ATP-dependent DNA helicase RecG
MFTLASIKSIIAGGEGFNTVFKILFSQEVIISLNAFANTEGGTVLVGVDNDGRITGIVEILCFHVILHRIFHEK